MKQKRSSRQSRSRFVSIRKTVFRKTRIRTCAALALALTALAFCSHAFYSSRVRAQDVHAKFQQDLQKVFANHEEIRIDPQSIAMQVRETGRLSLVTGSQDFEIQLKPNDLRAADYRAEEVGPDGLSHDVIMPGVSTYKGNIEGVWASDARFTVNDNQIEGMIITPGDSYFVEAAQKYSAVAQPTDYLVYRAADVRSDITRSCGSTLEQDVNAGARQLLPNASIGGPPAVFSPFKVVELATEADFEYTNALGGSAAANNDILSVMNQIQAIYERDLGLTFTVVMQHTWTTADPYSTAGPNDASVNLLNSFTTYWNTNFAGVARDDAHLWTGKDLGGPAGVAWMGVVCRMPSSSYGLSDIETMAPFRVGIPAHEIGHNLNASHCDGQAGCDNTIMVSTQTSANTLNFCPFSVNEMTSFINANSSCLSQAQPKLVQFGAASYSVNEGGGSAHITVTRTGDISGSATVDYRTSDTDTFTVGCADTVNNHGSAYGRCDFATVAGTASFGAGETSKTFDVPIIDDSYAEGNETFTVVLSNPTGATLGTSSTATVTINDNEIVSGPNPILQTNDAGIAFFVRQHYLDFLGREPEPGEPWSNVLRNCANQLNIDPNSPSAACDRITVSGGFFGSPEFKNKGVYVIDFYRVSFNRMATYLEFAQDLASVTGASAAETNAKRAAFANSFVQRTEFANTYGSLSNSDYVNALMSGTRGQGYNLTSITTPDPANPDGATKVTLTTADLINRLNAATMTRAQVLRAIVQSDQVTNIEAVNAFVQSQYYGYLRRTPDTVGFTSWVSYLNTHPGDFRTMVNGFLNSVEYRLRFGPG